MLYSKLQRSREAHGLNARIARGEQFEIGDVACGRQTATDIESCLLQAQAWRHASPGDPVIGENGATQNC